MSSAPARPAESREDDGLHRRAFFRVPACLAVRCRRVDAFELESLRREILATREAGGPIADPRLIARLDRIEHKIDRLTTLLRRDRTTALIDEQPQDIVISGSGMLLYLHEGPAVGDELLLEIALPGANGGRLRALARVASSSPATGMKHPFRVAVQFSAIDESDRDSIVRFAFEVQRADAARRAGASPR